MEEGPGSGNPHPMRPTSTATPTPTRQAPAPGAHRRRERHGGESHHFASGMTARAGNGGEATNQMRQEPRKDETWQRNADFAVRWPMATAPQVHRGITNTGKTKTIASFADRRCMAVATSALRVGTVMGREASAFGVGQRCMVALVVSAHRGGMNISGPSAMVNRIGCNIRSRAGRTHSTHFASGMTARAGNGGEATTKMRQKPRKE
jgi:hypothetical protein